MEKFFQEFTNVTNRSVNQTKFLLELLDGDVNKLVYLEFKLKNNHLSYCPGDKEEVERVLNMSDGTGWAFEDTLYKQLNNFLKTK